MGKEKIVAIDGGAGSGKSTISRLLARQIHFLYLDSGALYRALTLWWIWELGWNSSPNEFERTFLERKKKTNSKSFAHIEIRTHNGVPETLISGEKVDHLLRDIELTKRIKAVADDVASRKYVNQILKELAQDQSVVIDGRDIATQVFPTADYKFFLEAPVNIRAERRLRQEGEKEITKDRLAAAVADLTRRDRQDKDRKIGALERAVDATLISTEEKSIDEVVQIMRKKIGK